nr:MAG TPA: hypothetical protein [Caudoviricetes sp.]
MVQTLPDIEVPDLDDTLVVSKKRLSRFFSKLQTWLSSRFATKTHTHEHTDILNLPLSPVVVSSAEPTNSDTVIWIKTTS